METWLRKMMRTRILQIDFQVLLIVVVIPLNSKYVLANNNNENDYYSIVVEHQNCDHIIPRFIEQIMSQKNPNCDESGVFPKPGNCSVFFKCVQSDTKIQPFIEYCAVGYNFVHGVCVPSKNSTDCPQYTCRIPDGENEIGNKIESEDSFQSLPLMHSSTTSEVIEPIASSTITPPVETSLGNSNSNNTMMDETKPKETFLQMTQIQEKSGASLWTHNNMIISICIIISAVLSI